MLTHSDMLRRCASAYGSRIAIVSEDGVGITYRELDGQTNAVANALAARGFGRGDRMVWLDRNSADFLIAYYATAKLGMTFTPLNAWLRAAELSPQVRLIAPAVVAAGGDFLPLASAASEGLDVSTKFVISGPGASGWEPWSSLKTGSSTPPSYEAEENDVHEIIFTSGTTGQAKGVMRSQRARILDSTFAALGYGLRRDDHMLWFLPQFHIGGGAVPNQLLIQGGQVTVLRQYEPGAVAAALGSGVTYIVGVPAHYSLLFESGLLAGVDTSNVRGCYVGGSIASTTLFHQIQKEFPAAELVHGYGSTESGPHTMAVRGQAFLDHFGSLGQPVAGCEVRVVAESGSDADVDEIGELWTRSDSVMLGYLDNPELTAKTLSADGWLRTGDLVRLRSDGYYYLVDRAKDMIITGGENVYPREVEDVIASYPGVAEVAVIGVPDPLYEERVVALVRSAPGAVVPVAADVIAFVRERLAGFKTPKEVHIVDDFPRTGAGKIAKQALREHYGSVFGEQR